MEAHEVWLLIAVVSGGQALLSVQPRGHELLEIIVVDLPLLQGHTLIGSHISNNFSHLSSLIRNQYVVEKRSL